MQSTYVDIMIQSLEKKLKILDNIKKANLQIRTWAKDMKEDFTEEDTQMANKHIKIFPTLVLVCQVNFVFVCANVYRENM